MAFRNNYDFTEIHDILDSFSNLHIFLERFFNREDLSMSCFSVFVEIKVIAE